MDPQTPIVDVRIELEEVDGEEGCQHVESALRVRATDSHQHAVVRLLFTGADTSVRSRKLAGYPFPGLGCGSLRGARHGPVPRGRSLQTDEFVLKDWTLSLSQKGAKRSSQKQSSHRLVYAAL